MPRAGEYHATEILGELRFRGRSGVMVAFDKVCEVLRVPTTHDALTENLAKLVIEQARTGERNPDKLCEMTLKALAYRR
jgi:hypothetical protein